MKSRRDAAGVLFVGPDIRSQGGIATVIANYRRSRFWGNCKCAHFATCRDWDSAVARMAHSLWRYLVFAWVLLVSRPAVMSIHTALQVSYYRKLCYIILARLFAVPVVLHIHPAGFYEFFSEGGRFTRSAVSQGFRLCKQLVFLSQQSLEQFQPCFKEARMTVVPNPVDVEHVKSHGRLPAKGNYRILFMGWIIKEKGVYDIVDAMPEVIACFPQAEFLFAGNKEVERLTSVIEERRLSRHATVLGWVEGERKLELLRTSRLLLLPSYTEGIPNVILEAMASGLPAITCPVGGIPSVFVEGENGYFTPPANAKALAGRIIHMLGDDELCDKISNLTGQRANRLYSIEAIGRRLQQVYRPFLNMSSPA